jgi:hypothetical protein
MCGGSGWRFEINIRGVLGHWRRPIPRPLSRGGEGEYFGFLAAY